jgi:hypothetical protein
MQKIGLNKDEALCLNREPELSTAEAINLRKIVNAYFNSQEIVSQACLIKPSVKKLSRLSPGFINDILPAYLENIFPYMVISPTGELNISGLSLTALTIGPEFTFLTEISSAKTPNTKAVSTKKLITRYVASIQKLAVINRIPLRLTVKFITKEHSKNGVLTFIEDPSMLPMEVRIAFAVIPIPEQLKDPRNTISNFEQAVINPPHQETLFPGLSQGFFSVASMSGMSERYVPPRSLTPADPQERAENLIDKNKENFAIALMYLNEFATILKTISRLIIHGHYDPHILVDKLQRPQD